MTKGDLVRVARRWCESWPSLPKPVFSEETDDHGVVVHIYPGDVDALVLIDGQCEWVSLRGLEAINEVR